MKNLSHLVLPLDSHHQGSSLRTHASRLELLQDRPNVDLSVLPTLNLSLPDVHGSPLDGLLVLDLQFCGGAKLLAEEHGKHSAVLVDDGGSGSSVLNVGVSAELLARTEDAARASDAVGEDFFLEEVCAVEGEALEFGFESEVEKGTVELHVSVHDTLLQ